MEFIADIRFTTSMLLGMTFILYDFATAMGEVLRKTIVITAGISTPRTQLRRNGKRFGK